LEDAGKLSDQGPGVSGLRLKVDAVMAAARIGRELMQGLPREVLVYDWTQYHVNLFKALASQKTMMFVVLVLIVAVAAFNIVSALVMVVADKQADIAILRTLGLTPGGIMGVFIVQGTLIGVVGTLLGAFAGTWLATNVTTIVPRVEDFLQTKFFPPDVYHLSEVPSQLHWPDVLEVSLLAFLLCVLATLYPSWRAARTQPAEALRYE
jgi:lipoprotein-releasing system permease protein